MVIEVIGLPLCFVLASYLGARVLGIGFILFALFGGVYLAALAKDTFNITALWISLPLFLISVITLVVATFMGASHGAFDPGQESTQKTPA